MRRARRRVHFFVEKMNLEFPVLTDAGNQVATRYGPPPFAPCW